ncbi:hypothetical protein [Pseudooceanicola sp. MF1-13]|uniref:hypothetical protein n=1 Tax=Pseudooceanicola sp. MF1-13 TaxID=3379095 RepID=UPI003891330E
MSLTYAERLRIRAYETDGGDPLLIRAAAALDQQSRAIEELRSEPTITVAEHVAQSPWLGPILKLSN